jgi:hypothetical protein
LVAFLPAWRSVKFSLFTLYVSQLGVTSHEALSMWSGLTFSVTFLVSAIVSPMWGAWRTAKAAS